MFEEFQGVPAHPLLVHAAVVFVPLLALITLLYALLPFSRAHLRWVMFSLAFIGPGSALFAKLSGTAFFDRLQKAGKVSGGYIPKINQHSNFGTMTVYTTIALGVVALLLWFFVRPRKQGERGGFDFLSIVLAFVAVVAAGASVYYVVRTGDSGAKLVWTGY